MQQIPSPGTKNDQDPANTFGIPFSCLPKRRWPADHMSSAAGLGAFRGELLHEYRSAWTRGDEATAVQAVQCTLLTEASPAKPRGLAVWGGGQFRQVLSLEESSLRPLGSLRSHTPFLSPEQLLIWGSHPWSEQLHCSCAQSWPLYPGDLHLKPHPLSWLPSLTVDLPHHCDHPMLSVSAWLPHPSTERSYRWLADLTCLTSDLPCCCGLGLLAWLLDCWQSGLLAEAVITKPALLAMSRCCRMAPLLVRTLSLCLPRSAPGSPSRWNLWRWVLFATAIKTAASMGRLREAGWDARGEGVAYGERVQ